MTDKPEYDPSGMGPQAHDIVRIWSGEHSAWWRPNCCGYTSIINAAGIYTRAEAKAATSHCGTEKRIDIRRVNLRTIADTTDGKAALPKSSYHEDTGPVIWWTFPISEPGWIGTPSSSDWPGYHTHWTPLVVPNAFVLPTGEPA